MPPSPSDRALRSLVARLAIKQPDDIRAIVNALDPGQRQQIDRLLADYAGTPLQDQGRSEPLKAEPNIPDGLSPWLVARLNASLHQTPGPNGARDDGLHLGDSFSMTAPAVQALKAAAARMQPTVRAPVALRAGGLWSLLDDLWRGRSSWRASS